MQPGLSDLGTPAGHNSCKALTRATAVATARRVVEASVVASLLQVQRCAPARAPLSETTTLKVLLTGNSAKP